MTTREDILRLWCDRLLEMGRAGTMDVEHAFIARYNGRGTIHFHGHRPGRGGRCRRLFVLKSLELAGACADDVLKSWADHVCPPPPPPPPEELTRYVLTWRSFTHSPTNARLLCLLEAEREALEVGLTWRDLEEVKRGWPAGLLQKTHAAK